MAPRRVEDVPVPKRIAAAGCKLSAQLPAGEILTDITQNKWRLGNTIGYGGFGDIYLGSNLDSDIFMFLYLFMIYLSLDIIYIYIEYKI